VNDIIYTRMLAELIAFDTTSCRSNLPLIEYVETYLRDFDCRVERIAGETPDKVNLWVTIGPPDRSGYVLSGHSDTVPVDGQVWTSNPYQLRSADGRLYGRGAADMKGFLAVCLAHVPEMAAAPLLRPIHLAISCDEELGCRGVPSLLKEISHRPVQPLGCFVGEPTRMAVVAGHKGSRRYRTTVHGSCAHTSLAPLHVNAIECAAQIVEEIRRTAGQIATHWPQDPRYKVPYSTLLTTTIQGGTAINIVPGHCVMEWECRTIPADEASGIPESIMDFARNEILPGMRSKRDEAAIEFEQISTTLGLDTDDGHPLVQLAQSLNCDAGNSRRVQHVDFGSEAGLFDQAGIPSVVIGPGSIEQAHKPDEYVEMTQLAACGRFVSGLIAACCR